MREHSGKWDKTMGYPPVRWFDELLDIYYEERGWDKRGIGKAPSRN